MTIRFTIYGEPASKANSRKPATVGKADNRRTIWIKSDKARDYESAAIPQIPDSAKLMLAGKIRMTLRIFYCSELPDLDESIVLDVLQAKFARDKKTGKRELIRRGVYINDRQVRERHVYHGIDKVRPRAEIEIEPLDGELFQ